MQVYDTDGNFLQGLDTIEMRRLLPLFLSRVTAEFAAGEDAEGCNADGLRLVDLGCGTGRNTVQLVAHAPENARIVGLDASPGMLEIAREAVTKRIGESPASSKNVHVDLEVFDLLQKPLVPPQSSLEAMGVVSTLVVEHIPLKTFFEGAAALLRPGGFLLVTNMHSEMGSISQAGFVDVKTGTKIRPTSYSHSIPHVLAAAEACGFRIEELGGEEVMEKSVTQELAEVLGKRAKKWVGIKVWFGMCFKKSR